MPINSENTVKTEKGLRVYVSAADLDAPAGLNLISCEARRAEIEKIGSAAGRAEKILAWLLLEYAVKDTFGMKLPSFSPRKTESGKWVADGIFFSISHSDGIAAVAVSDEPVGVDIQAEVVPRAKNFAKKTLTEAEFAELSGLSDKDKSERVIELWSKKEALFKLAGEGVFSPRLIDTHSHVSSARIRQNGCDAVLAVASRAYASFTLISDVNTEDLLCRTH